MDLILQGVHVTIHPHLLTYSTPKNATGTVMITMHKLVKGTPCIRAQNNRTVIKQVTSIRVCTERSVLNCEGMVLKRRFFEHTSSFGFLAFPYYKMQAR